MRGVVVAADGFTIDCYQRFVGDPLQIRGIGLGTQIRSLFAIVAILALFVPAINVYNVLNFALWMFMAFFDDYPELECRTGENPARNPRRFLPTFIGMRMFTWFAAAVMYSMGMWYWIFVVAARIAEACDPKPRRPKRVSVLVPAEAS